MFAKSKQGLLVRFCSLKGQYNATFPLLDYILHTTYYRLPDPIAGVRGAGPGPRTPAAVTWSCCCCLRWRRRVMLLPLCRAGQLKEFYSSQELASAGEEARTKWLKAVQGTEC